MANIFDSVKWREIMHDVYGFEIYTFQEITAYIVRKPLFRKKITNMPYNFYPDISPEEAVATLRCFTEYCKRESGMQAEIKLLQPAIPEKLVKELGWSAGNPFVQSKLLLGDSAEITYAASGKNLIKNIRRIRNKIVKEDITIVQASSIAEVDKFFGLLLRVYRDRHQMPCHPQKLYRTLYQSRVAHFYLAKYQENIVGGVVIIPDGGVWHYCWGATHPEYLGFGVSMALLDVAISDAIAAKAREFDFGTSSPHDTELLEFKRRWGCFSDMAHHYYYPATTKLAALDYHTSYQFLRSVYRYTPASLLKRMLPIVVPFFG